MIAHLLRALSFLRILREERHRYADVLRGGAIDDSDLAPEASEAQARCVRGEHRAAGESMPDACADCGVDWADIDDAGYR